MKLCDIKAPLTPSILDWLLGTDVNQASPLFSVFDLLNVNGLVVLFRKAETSIFIFLKEQFSSELSSQIDAYNIADDVPGLIKEGLVEVFNRIVDGDCVTVGSGLSIDLLSTWWLR